MSGEECVDVYYCTEESFDKKVYLNKNEKKLNVYTEFNELDDDLILFMLLLSLENCDYSMILNENYNIENVNKLLKIDCFKYNFILGSGVSIDFNAQSWDDLIDEMRNNISKIKKVNVDDIKKLEDKLCNTNYVIPQIEKDIDKDRYFNDIYNSLYSKYNPVILKSDKIIQDFSLYEVAKIISTQVQTEDTQRVLTFNYDNFLEQMLTNVFNLKNVNSAFKNGNIEKNYMINVIHPHGFMPYNNKKEEFNNSIILSTLEYMNAYNPNSYAYRALYKQLDSTNIIIGNSLVDYEEQKVFRNHHKMHLSSYHFILTEKNKINWFNGYKILYFLKLGVIPIFVDKKVGYSSYLKTFLS